MPERRFRDMSLTEDEVESLLFERLYHGSYSGTSEHAYRLKLTRRAKRLLPLWRKRGLEELQTIAFEDGKASVWGRP